MLVRVFRARAGRTGRSGRGGGRRIRCGATVNVAAQLLIVQSTDGGGRAADPLRREEGVQGAKWEGRGRCVGVGWGECVCGRSGGEVQWIKVDYVNWHGHALPAYNNIIRYYITQ